MIFYDYSCQKEEKRNQIDKKLKFRVFYPFYDPLVSNKTPEYFSKIFSQLIYLPSNRTSHKCCFFLNLMSMAHDLSQKLSKNSMKELLNSP